MFEDEKSIEEKRKFNEFLGKFLSEIAKVTKNPMIKSMDSVNKLINKLHNLINKEKKVEDTYYKNVYNFSEQLNELVDDFIKENK